MHVTSRVLHMRVTGEGVSIGVSPEVLYNLNKQVRYRSSSEYQGIDGINALLPQTLPYARHKIYSLLGIRNT